MNNTTKTTQELAQEAFIAKLSGIAEYKNPNEIQWEDNMEIKSQQNSLIILFPISQ